MSASSSQQARQKKKLGHAEETMFNVIFGHKKLDDMNFSGASEDNFISDKAYQEKIEKELGKLKDYTVSLKSGVTWQFHIGRIDELSDLKKIKLSKTTKGETKIIHNVNFNRQLAALRSQSFWNKYLKKGELLCYINQHKKYTFFKLDDVIRFLIKSIEWRLMPTGRLKGDILFNNRKLKGVITFEYKDTHKSFALGAMGGKNESANGFRLFQILLENIKYCEIDTSSKMKTIDKITSKQIPKNPNMNGNIGQISFDENNLYLCIGVKKWKRVKFSSWSNQTITNNLNKTKLKLS